MVCNGHSSRRISINNMEVLATTVAVLHRSPRKTSGRAANALVLYCTSNSDPFPTTPPSVQTLIFLNKQRRNSTVKYQAEIKLRTVSPPSCFVASAGLRVLAEVGNPTAFPEAAAAAAAAALASAVTPAKAASAPRWFSETWRM